MIKTSSGQNISLNVCQNVRSELFGLKDDIEAGDVGGFMRRAHGDFAFGFVFDLLLQVRTSDVFAQ